MCYSIIIKRKFLKLIKVSSFLFNGETFKSVQVKSGIRQERLLSSILFHMILDSQFSKKRKQKK